MKKILLTLSPFALIALLIYVYSGTGRASGSSKKTYEKFYETTETISQNWANSNISGEISEDDDEDNEVKVPESMEPITINPNTMQPSGIDTNPESITVLVNKMYSLESTYEPEDLVVPDIKFSTKHYDPKMQLRQVAATAMENLFQAALDDGIELAGVSGYRSYNRQLEIYAHNLMYRGITFTTGYSAMAGYSEHQTGLAMDISTSSIGYKLCDQFADTKEGQWVQNHCYEYGFIVRYPADKTQVTGYAYEPWHIRYVGVELATYLYDHDLTLDEYYGYQYDEALYADVDYDAIIDQYYEMKGTRRKRKSLVKDNQTTPSPMDDFSDIEDLEEENINDTPADPTKTPEEITTTPNPTNTPEPTEKPEPTVTEKPTKAPKPTKTPEPTKSPEETVTPEVTATPKPTEIPEETVTPEPSEPLTPSNEPTSSDESATSDEPTDSDSETEAETEPTHFSEEVPSDDTTPEEPILEP